MKRTPVDPLKWSAYGAFFGALLVVWRTDLGLPGMFDFNSLRFYALIGELVGGAVSAAVVAYIAAVVTNRLRR